MTPAAALAERGFAVFPLKVGEKTPATPDHAANSCSGRDPRCRDGHQGWEPRATTDPDRIARGWAKVPYNVGVACGPSRLVVIDLDMPKADKPIPGEWQLPGVNDGKDEFAWVCEAAGMDFPFDTYIVQTPTGGWHLYFQAPPDTTFTNKVGNTPFGPLVDVRARGGFVVGAGSVTAAGEYEVLYDNPVQPLPNWIARLLTPPETVADLRPFSPTSTGPGRLQGLVRTVETARPGTRNNVLFWAAATCAEFAPEDLDQLADAAARAGLDDGEIRATIASAQRRVAA